MYLYNSYYSIGWHASGFCMNILTAHGPYCKSLLIYSINCIQTTKWSSYVTETFWILLLNQQMPRVVYFSFSAWREICRGGLISGDTTPVLLQHNLNILLHVVRYHDRKRCCSQLKIRFRTSVEYFGIEYSGLK